MLYGIGFGRGEQGDRAPPWIFINDTDKVEKSLMVLLFGLIFFRSPPPLPPPTLLPFSGNFSANVLAI